MSQKEPSEDTETLTLHVAKSDAGARLDKFLATAAPDLSRSRIKSLANGGHVKRLSPTTAVINSLSKPVKLGEIYQIDIPPVAPAVPQAEAIPLEIVYEDDHLVVVNKAPGMVVHPAPGALSGTLVNALIHHCGDSLSGIGGVARPGIVHRIDKDTSGLLVVAKSDAAHKGLAIQFEEKTSKREYIALVKGIPSPLEGRIEANIARHPVDRKRMAVIEMGGRWAATRYKVDTAYYRGGKPLAARIRCRLETGRTHQVRVHMAHLGHPLIGDPVYARPLRAKGAETGNLNQALARFQRQALHAALLGFKHPVSGENLQFSAELPHDMSMLLDVFAPYAQH